MYTGRSELPMALIHQHIVTATPCSAEEIRPICFTPFPAKTFPGLTTVDTPRLVQVPDVLGRYSAISNKNVF